MYFSFHITYQQTFCFTHIILLYISLIYTHSLSYTNINFHIRTVHHDIIQIFYSPTNAQVIVFKTILNFTLK